MMERRSFLRGIIALAIAPAIRLRQIVQPNYNYVEFTSHYKWNAGLVASDWRYLCRIATIDMSGLKDT